MSLSKDAILAAQDCKVVAVEVPEWGGTVYVRTISGTERDSFDASLLPDPDSKRRNFANIRARFVALVLCDEKGVRLCKNEEASALGAKSSLVLNRIWQAGRKLNAMDPDDVDEAEKNSDSDPSAASGSV